MFAIGPNAQIAFDDEFGEPLKGRRVYVAAHDEAHLGGDFHVGLEADVATGRAFDHEPEVDVNDVSVLVEHQIAIVSIFDLNKKHEQTVAGHGHDEIATRALKFGRVGSSVLVQKVLIQIGGRLTSDLIARVRLGHTFDHAAARLRGYHPIRKQKQLETFLFEYVLDKLHDLQRKHVLTHVVAYFKYARTLVL